MLIKAFYGKNISSEFIFQIVQAAEELFIQKYFVIRSSNRNSGCIEAAFTRRWFEAWNVLMEGMNMIIMKYDWRAASVDSPHVILEFHIQSQHP